MRNKLIKWLGGITKKEHEAIRSMYEKWAVENLIGKHSEVTPDSFIYTPLYGDDIIIIRSRITILGGVIKGLKIAPWCKEVVSSGLAIVGDEHE